MAVPRQSAAYDERRNTSRVHAVPPGALTEATRALQTISAPLRQWIAQGAPRLTAAEHVERFGSPYDGKRARGR